MVLDRLLSVNRASEIAVVFEGSCPDAESVRKALAQDQPLPVIASDKHPRVLTSLDDFLLDSRGDILDRVTRTCVRAPLSLTVVPATMDFGAEDLVRIWHITTKYPEIKIEKAFREFIASSTALFSTYRSRFPEINLALYKYERGNSGES